MSERPFGITEGWWLVWSLASSFVWLIAVVGALRTKDSAWRDAGSSRAVWVAALVVTSIVQRFLPYAALGVPSLAVALAYLLFMKPRLVQAVDQQEDRRASAFESISRDMRSKTVEDGEQPPAP